MTTEKPSWLLTYEEPEIDEIHGALMRLLAAIQAWAKAEDVALDARIENLKRENGGEIPGEYDGFSDADCWIRETEQTMFAGLAVAIASAVDPYFKAITKKHMDAGKEPAAAKKAACAELNALAHHADYNRARILANCFKHSDGNISRDYVDTYDDGRNEGDEIDYRAENWKSIIDGLRLFLFQVCGT